MSPPRELLSAVERDELLHIARESIGAALGCVPEPIPRLLTPALLAHTGAFVSVYVHDELRGCVGHVYPAEPLHVTVAVIAPAAACQDGRFAPLHRDEWARMTVELSLLTPPVVTHLESIVPGRHGLYVIQGDARGLLLPQVATRYGWTAEEFVRATCQKAGLPADAWRDPKTEILAFEAEIFRG